MYVCVCLHTGMCVQAQVPKAANGDLWSTVIGVTDSWELPSLGARNLSQYSARRVHSLLCWTIRAVWECWLVNLFVLLRCMCYLNEFREQTLKSVLSKDIVRVPNVFGKSSEANNFVSIQTDTILFFLNNCLYWGISERQRAVQYCIGSKCCWDFLS